MKTSKLIFTIFSIFLITSLWGCSDDSTGPDDSQESVISKEKAIKTTIQILRDQGFDLPSKSKKLKNGTNSLFGLSFSDYITTKKKKESRSGPKGKRPTYYREVQIYIGPDGNMIPSGQWRSNHKNKCKSQNRYLKSGIKLLTIEVHTIIEGKAGYIVNAQYTDVGSGKIEAGTNAEGDNLQKVEDKAFNELQKKKSIGGFVGPCGEKRGLKFTIESTFSTNVSGNSFSQTESVMGTVNLTYNEKRDVYKGESDIMWDNFELESPLEVAIDISCDLPADFPLDVQFIDGKSEGQKMELDISNRRPSSIKTSCMEIHSNGDTTYSQPTSGLFPWDYFNEPQAGGSIKLQNGKSVRSWNFTNFKDKSGIEVTKMYNRSTQRGSREVKEETKIKIRSK